MGTLYNAFRKKWSLVTSMMLLLLCSNHINAQNTGKKPESNPGVIKGKVITDKGEPAPYVSLKLKGTSYGGSTGKNGLFKIKAPAGKYTLKLSSVGLAEKAINVRVVADTTRMLETIRLEESIEELKAVVISDSTAKKVTYSDPESEYVNKMPLKKIDNPQVYNSVSDELLEDQVATTVDEGMQNVPGITRLWKSTGRGGDGAGFYSLRGFSVQPTMRNGMPAFTNGVLDPANVKNIEVIKGPSGTLYGNGNIISYGGLINVVTKKPYKSFGGELSYITGSFGLNRVTADINTPLSEEKDVAMRVNTAYHSENSWQDAGFRESFFIAPSLSYEVNDKLSFMINTEFYSQESTNPTMLFLNRSDDLEYDNLEDLNYNPELSYTSNDITINNPGYNMQGVMRYELSENWVSRTIVSRSKSKTDGYYSYLWDYAGDALDGQFGRFVQKANSVSLGTNVQQNFTGTFKLAGMEHKMVVGLDYLNQQTIDNSTGFVAHDRVRLGNGDAGSISRPAVDTSLATSPINKSRSEQRTYSAYASDVITVLPKLSVMASLRYDYFDNQGTYNPDADTTEDAFSQSAFSPKFGVMYQPVEDKVSLFANYMNGFTYPEPQTQGDGSIMTFEPEHANQWETGVKVNLLDEALMATVTYYNITVTNKVRNDPDRANFNVQDGRHVSEGYEVSVTASPLAGLDLVAGFSHNTSALEKANEVEEGKRPGEAGPRTLVNGWASYRIPKGALKGLGAGFGGNYASKNKMMQTYGVGTFVLPSYTVFNASLFYEQPEYRITLKANNLTDEEYYKGWSTVNPQMPANFRAAFTYKF